MYINGNKKRCPVCHRIVDKDKLYCKCDYEFGGNRCTNPECGSDCGDFESFCPECGSETVNYMNGYIGGIPTNVN